MASVKPKTSKSPRGARTHTVLYLNGVRHQISAEQSRLMLADYLREHLGLTGTKIVCAEGDCGACSVLRFRPDPKGRTAKTGKQNSPLYQPINSCITTVAQMDGSSLVTVEALGDPQNLHPVQKAMVECHGSQCGFCTPGFVIALTGLVEKKLCANGAPGSAKLSDSPAPGSAKLSDSPAPVSAKPAAVPTSITAREAKNATTGNLCRCTGYQPIIQAATKVTPGACPSVASRFYSKAQEKDLLAAAKQPLYLKSNDFEFYAPTRLKDAVHYLRKNKAAKVVAAATDLGVIHNKFKQRLTQVVSLHLIADLNRIELIKASRGPNPRERVRVGARVTLTELREAIKNKIPEFARFLDIFASPQIKNVATLAGNVANASPIADTPPFLLVANGLVHIAGRGKTRKVPMEKFFLGYRKTALKPGELITAIEFDVPTAEELLRLRKVSERKDLDISTVNAAFWLRREKSGAVTEARLALGGVAATTRRLPLTEKYLRGKFLDKDTVAQATELLQKEITPISDVRGSSAYRRILAENLFRAFAESLGGR